jgi:Rrf2 family nitric oxide-sensitive transcriptional repressor
MITKTTLSALRALLFVAATPGGRRVSPREVADTLGESPTYMAKVARELVKAGILRADKGVKGGLYLDRPASEITLREIVRACQGEIIGDYCRFPGDPRETCSYHQAAGELHEAVTRVLSAWTLARLMERPCSAEANPRCVMRNQRAAKRL